ncbi:MAG: serine/threonine-protein kinase [Polyangiaceae bacterium]
MAMSAPATGLVVASRYRLEEILGEGGMAVVWRARHTETDRSVALKLVRRDLVRDEQVREMFVREARITARIGSNKHIVDVLDAGVDAALEVPFIAMELLVGEGLDARIKKQGPVEPGLAAEWVEQLADALDQAHGAGVVHRDLKPQNLFLARDKRQRVDVKVLDFGIAKLAESVTQSSTQVGTPAYSAPEQLGASWRTISAQRGKPIAEHVSAATDVWAMGLVVYEMLVGGTSGSLWGATTLAELPVKMILEPTPVASARAAPRGGLIPPGFDAWLARCLDVDATKRFSSAGEAAAAVVPLLRARAQRGSHANLEAQAPPAQPAATGWGHGPSAHATPNTHGPGWSTPPVPSLPVATPLPYAPPTAWAPPPPGAWSAPTERAKSALDPRIPPHFHPWIAARGAEIGFDPNPQPYFAWNPLYFIPRIRHVYREARLSLRDATVCAAEVSIDDGLRSMTGESRPILGFLRSPRILYSAAVRTREGTGVADGVVRALDSLFTSSSLKINDPRFERQFDVGCDSPQMGNAALPLSLRELLLMGFRGKLELRAGGFVVHLAHVNRFEPQEIDALLDVIARIYFTLAP